MHATLGATDQPASSRRIHKRVTPAERWVEHGLRDGARGPGLWSGVPALAYAAQHGGGHGVFAATLDATTVDLACKIVDRAHRRMDRRIRPVHAEFDTTRGLAGLGAYLLALPHHHTLLQQVLECLVRLCQPIAARDVAGNSLPGWWAGRRPAETLDGAVGVGCSRLGMAQGIAGVLALLANSLRSGVVVPGQVAAIEQIRHWLTRWYDLKTGGWPERLTAKDVARGTFTRPITAASSWATGTIGIARSLQLAAMALGDYRQQHAAEQVLVAWTRRHLSDSTTAPVGVCLCHGWAGITATLHRAAHDALTPALAMALPHVVDKLIDSLHSPARTPVKHSTASQKDFHSAHFTACCEAAGASLVINDIATETPTDWATCMLIG